MPNDIANKREGTLDRRELVKSILDRRGDALVVTGLGSSCYDCGVHDHSNTFYLWGAMGAAAMMGLGLALAQPSRRVIVITGDGEMLMGLGSLATIGAKQPANLSIVVIDNELYSETGMQPTHTARGVSLSGMAKAATFSYAETIYSDAELERGIDAIYDTAGPVLIAVKVSNKRYPMSIRMRDGAHIKNRFRENLLGSKAFD
jgi:thiamine pyrophosphate-dependent acetolactate synthase large subunit-like protein